jgi:hypothetical protein
MVKSWGENVAKLVERFGSAGRFDSFHNFAGNLTPPAPKELACYIPLSEVFKIIMEARHQNQTIHQLLEDDAIAPLYIPHHLMYDAKELAGASHLPAELMLFSMDLQSTRDGIYAYATFWLQARSINVKSDSSNYHHLLYPAIL